jgi:hypothetical protein
MSTQWLRAASSRGGIAAVRATRFVGSLGEMTLPQSKVVYLKDPSPVANGSGMVPHHSRVVYCE